MNANILIQPIGTRQRDLLIAMYDRFDPLGAAFGLPPPTAEARHNWIGSALGQIVNVAAFSPAGEVLGHCFLAADKPGSAETVVFVHQESRRRGIGAALIKKALEWAWAAELGRVWAVTAGDNRGALRLLVSCGFRLIQPAWPSIRLACHTGGALIAPRTSVNAERPGRSNSATALGAVSRALIPLTPGHALAIAAAVLVAVAAGAALPVASLKLPVAVTLGALGVYRLIRHSHFSGSGMRVGMGGRTAWSFLMATCHGACLMVLPVFLGMTAPVHGGSCHAAGMVSANAATAAAATVVHGAGYLIVTAALAWAVFTKIGVGILRRAWFNLDLIWAIALIGTGILTVAV